MNTTVRKRIEQINRGEVPQGYKRTKIGIIPEDWEVLKLEELSIPLKDKVGDATLESLSISAGTGFVNQAKKFGKDLAGNQYKNYIVIKMGDFSYNKGNSKKYPNGCIYRLFDRQIAAVPNVFESFRIIKGVPEFYEQLFLMGFLNNQLSKKINHGVRDDGLLNLSEKDFYDSSLPYPQSQTEQQKIAEILQTQDRAIELQEQLIEQYKQFKKSLLDKMFPKKGSCYPEIRFPGFTAPWEQRKLGAMAPLRGGYAFQSAEYKKHGIPIIRISNILADGTIGGDFSYYEPISDDENFVVENGDAVLAMSGATTGKVSILSVESAKYYQNQRVGLFLRTKNTSYEFITTIVCSDLFSNQLKNVLVAGAQPNVSAKDIDSFEFYVPQDKCEQEKVGILFVKLDNLITLHQRKLEEMKNYKKALMQLLLTGIVRV